MSNNTISLKKASSKQSIKVVAEALYNFKIIEY